MVYDFTQNPPRTLVDDGEGHLVDTRVVDSLNNGRPVFIDCDENGHAYPVFAGKEF